MNFCSGRRERKKKKQTNACYWIKIKRNCRVGSEGIPHVNVQFVGKKSNSYGTTLDLAWKIGGPSVTSGAHSLVGIS